MIADNNVVLGGGLGGMSEVNFGFLICRLICFKIGLLCMVLCKFGIWMNLDLWFWEGNIWSKLEELNVVWKWIELLVRIDFELAIGL